jgi:hypothetical protein
MQWIARAKMQSFAHRAWTGGDADFISRKQLFIAFHFGKRPPSFATRWTDCRIFVKG